MKCPDCKRDFPAHLLSEMAISDDAGLRYEMKCPLCALAAINRLHGLPEQTPFRGERAKAMYAEAVSHLKNTEGQTHGST